MTSPKLLLVLAVASLSQAAPQINERQVVGDVVAQLQPAIQQALASITSGSSSFSAPSVSTSRRFSSTSSIPTTRFSAGSGRTGSFGSGRFSGATGVTKTSYSTAPSYSTGSSYSTAPSSSASVSSLTSSVVSSLQPSIAAAVAQALAGSSRRNTAVVSNEPNYDEPASYQFSYKVADDEAQAYMAHEENREGDAVTGKYNYVDPTGSLVTVNYQAGPEGYSETRDKEEGAVAMRNVPVGWDGPLAGVDDVQTTGVTSSRGSSSSSATTGLSQSDLIAQILAAIQPRISSAVQSALSSSTTSVAGTRASGLGQNSFVTSQNVGRSSYGSGQSNLAVSRNVARSNSGSGQSNIVSSVISSLQPRISSAVTAALSNTRTVAAPRRVAVRPAPRFTPAAQAPASGNLAGLFGVQGENNVRIATPEFNIEY